MSTVTTEGVDQTAQAAKPVITTVPHGIAINLAEQLHHGYACISNFCQLRTLTQVITP